MIFQGYVSIKELSDKYGVSTRTIHNRLADFRREHPEAFQVVHLENGRPMFLYKQDCLSEQMITKRHYIKRKGGQQIDYNPPPVFVRGQDGKAYNLISVKALLLLLKNTSKLEKFMGLNLLFWCGVILYIWSV